MAISNNLKQIVIRSRGQELKQYYGIFVDADDLLQKTFENFSNRSEKIITEMKTEIKKVEKDKLNMDMQSAEKRDTESAEDLLTKLNQI
jgi:hypothetical protein